MSNVCGLARLAGPSPLIGYVRWVPVGVRVGHRKGTFVPVFNRLQSTPASPRFFFFEVADGICLFVCFLCVNTMGNQQSAETHEPPRPEVAPVKSALYRSRSISNQLNTNKDSTSQSRYLPKGLSKIRHNSNVSNISSKTGETADMIESPQWGVSHFAEVRLFPS